MIFRVAKLITRRPCKARFFFSFIYPIARREAPADGRMPEGEGANLDRHLVPYYVKQGECNLESSF